MSDSELIDAAILILTYVVLSLTEKEKEPRKNRKLIKTIREDTDSSLIQFLQKHNVGGKLSFFPRMSTMDFQLLLKLVTPKIQHQNTRFRAAIPAYVRLAVTLKYLATGDTFTSFKSEFGISAQVISRIVPEVCEAIVEKLRNYVKIPRKEEEWIKVSEGFRNKCNFPQAIGAAGVRHIITAKGDNGDLDNPMLLAIVDSEHNFLYANVSNLDLFMLEDTIEENTLGEIMDEAYPNPPTPKALQNRNKPIPYHFLGDATFPLCDNFLKPYEGTHIEGSKEDIFNRRLSEGRRTVEDVFRVISDVFGILKKKMRLKPIKAETIVMSIVFLHNFLKRSSSKSLYMPDGCFNNETANLESFLPLKLLGDDSKEEDFINNRDELAEYFMNEGKMSE